MLTKSCTINLRLSTWEHARITENARLSGMTVSEYLRAVGMNVVVTGTTQHCFVHRNEVLQDAT